MKEYEIDKENDMVGFGNIVVSGYNGLIGTRIYKVNDGFIATYKENYAVHTREMIDSMKIALQLWKEPTILRYYLKGNYPDVYIVKYKFKKKRKKFWLFGKLF